MDLRGSVLARVRRHLSIILVAAVTATLTAGGPVVLAGITDADSVDGFSARSSTGTPARRANLLVAANAEGYLPNNILRKAPDANKLDGLDSAAFVRSAALDWIAVQPAPIDLGRSPGRFQCLYTPIGDTACRFQWRNEGGGWGVAAFARDAFGIVHIQGVIHCYGPTACDRDGAPTEVIFTLPVGYRPAANAIFPAISVNQIARITINTAGWVIAEAAVDTEQFITLDGISFAAAP